RPDAIALVHDDSVVSYGELDARANRLAHHLRRLGVGPDRRVAICVERSAPMVVGLLAILKAGAAYVPLDPDSPAERQALLVADCSATVVLHALGRRPDLPGVLCLDTILQDATVVVQDAVREEALAPAYVMYTSGSTGLPKGVVVPHRTVINLVLNRSYACFQADDRFAFASNPAFDSSTLEVWGALLCGGTIVVVPQAVLLDPVGLAGLVR